MREVIRRLDPDLPVDDIRPMTVIVRASLFDQMLELGVLGLFALFAVVLAAAGIYGVMTYAIAQRQQEFGIRIALGASSRDIVRLVGLEGARLTAVGTSLGVGLAWAASRVLRDLLFGVGPTEPLIFTAAAALLGLIAMAACVVPTIRAVLVNPLATLRSQ